MEVVNVREARENIARLLDAVSAGAEVVIVRRGKPVAKLVNISGSQRGPLRFTDRRSLREKLPPAVRPSAELIRALREERY
jgi:prevent-host-death family protein